MVRHIVLFRFKSDLTDAAIKAVFKAIGELQQPIPEIRHYSWGSNVSPENLHKGFQHGFTMDFDNESDRDTYLYHPKHQAIVQDVILPSLENSTDSALVFDYVMA